MFATHSLLRVLYKAGRAKAPRLNKNEPKYLAKSNSLVEQLGIYTHVLRLQGLGFGTMSGSSMSFCSLTILPRTVALIASASISEDT